jgi:hypothetical protein
MQASSSRGLAPTSTHAHACARMRRQRPANLLDQIWNLEAWEGGPETLARKHGNAPAHALYNYRVIQHV